MWMLGSMKGLGAMVATENMCIAEWVASRIHEEGGELTRIQLIVMVSNGLELVVFRASRF